MGWFDKVTQLFNGGNTTSPGPMPVSGHEPAHDGHNNGFSPTQDAVKAAKERRAGVMQDGENTAKPAAEASDNVKEAARAAACGNISKATHVTENAAPSNCPATQATPSIRTH